MGRKKIWVLFLFEKGYKLILGLSLYYGEVHAIIDEIIEKMLWVQIIESWMTRN